jgi:hypothetical protein
VTDPLDTARRLAGRPRSSPTVERVDLLLRRTLGRLTPRPPANPATGWSPPALGPEVPELPEPLPEDPAAAWAERQ